MPPIGEREVRALLEALEAGEVRKPFQVAKREVFKRYGILGTRLDAYFTAIIYKIYRMQGVLDRAAASALGVSPSSIEEMDVMLRQSLRLAAFIAQFDPQGDRELASALARHGLRILARRYGWREARMVYRVMDRLWRNPWRPANRQEELMYRYMAPPYIIEALSKLLPPGEVEEFLEASNRAPVLGVRVNTLKATTGEVLEELRRAGVEAWVSERVEVNIRYRGPFSDAHKRLLAEGKIVPQDESSTAASILLDPKPGEYIADLCAAPGGKTTHIAEITRLSSRIVAFDIHRDRLERLDWLARVTGTRGSILPLKADAVKAPNILGEESVDRVLLDPPCSTTGAIHKNTDARWRLSRERLEKLVALQREILRAGARILRPGGLMLYTVCSILPEEGEYNVKWAVENLGLRLVPLEGPYPESPLLPGTLRAWPHRHGTTGFFYALLEKKAVS